MWFMVWFMVSRASRFIRGSDCMNPVSPALNCPMSLSMLLARVADSFSPASTMGNDRNSSFHLIWGLVEVPHEPDVI